MRIYVGSIRVRDVLSYFSMEELPISELKNFAIDGFRVPQISSNMGFYFQLLRDQVTNLKLVQF